MSNEAITDVFANIDPALAQLRKKDRVLDIALRAIGQPVIRRRDGGFAGLFRIIVEQQVSVPSAQAILSRIHDRFETVTPDIVTEAGEDALRAVGFSRPKCRYVLALAQSVKNGGVDFDFISTLSDAPAMAALTSLLGIGPWSAGIYLLFCEGRVDIWPVGDVALRHAYNAGRGQAGVEDMEPLTQRGIDAHADSFAPFRGIAAHILWTYYAQLRSRDPI